MPNEIGDGPGVKGISKDTRGRGTPATTSTPAGGFGAGGGVESRGSVRGLPSTPQGKPSTRRSDSGAAETGSGAAGTGPGDGGGVMDKGASGNRGRGMPGAAPPPASARALPPGGTGVPVESQNARTLTQEQQQPSLGGRNQAEDANASGLRNRAPQPQGFE